LIALSARSGEEFGTAQEKTTLTLREQGRALKGYPDDGYTPGKNQNTGDIGIRPEGNNIRQGLNRRGDIYGRKGKVRRICWT
jgi:hypothetical protein